MEWNIGNIFEEEILPYSVTTPEIVVIYPLILFCHLNRYERVIRVFTGTRCAISWIGYLEMVTSLNYPNFKKFCMVVTQWNIELLLRKKMVISFTLKH